MTRRDSARIREAAVVRLRLQGLDFRSIAETLGLAGPSSAWRVYTRALDRNIADGVGDLRRLEGARLDQLQSAHWLKALDGNYRSSRIVLACMERRAKLFGLEAPARVQVNSELDAEVEAAVEALVVEVEAQTLARHADALHGRLAALEAPPAGLEDEE
jgi:hypothetical protein